MKEHPADVKIGFPFEISSTGWCLFCLSVIVVEPNKSLLLPRLRGDLVAGSLHQRRTERVGGVDTSQRQQGNQGRRELYLALPPLLHYC